MPREIGHSQAKVAKTPGLSVVISHVNLQGVIASIESLSKSLAGLLQELGSEKLRKPRSDQLDVHCPWAFQQEAYGQQYRYNRYQRTENGEAGRTHLLGRGWKHDAGSALRGKLLLAERDMQPLGDTIAQIGQFGTEAIGDLNFNSVAHLNF